jgi:hypothetical protein
VRELAEPTHGGSLIALWIAIPEHHADAQRVVERDAPKLAGRGRDQELVRSERCGVEALLRGWQQGCHPGYSLPPGRSQLISCTSTCWHS